MAKSFHRIISICFLTFMLVLFSCTCSALNEENVSLSLSSESLVVYCGTPTKLTYTLDNLENKNNVKVAWSSADTSIATVTSGSISGKAPGETEITCTVTLKDGTALTATCPVEIRKSVTSITCKTQTLKVDVGQQSDPIVIQIAPENAFDKTLVWSSSDESIATVADGVVTGVKAGTVTITAKTADESLTTAKSATCRVTVLQPVNQVTLDVQKLEIGKGSNSKLVATVLPEDASDKKLTWTSSDPAVASVAATGTVTAKAPGTATITATATRSDGTVVTASAEITVFTPTTGVKLPTAPISVDTHTSTEPIQFSVTPAAATYQGVTWASSDTSIATVDANGVVTGVKAGKVKITATSTAPVSGNAKAPSASMQVNVLQPVERVTLDTQALEIGKGSTSKLVATVLPEDASDKKLTWTSSDPAVASVAATGTVTAKAPGTATITAAATRSDGTQVTASVKVTVFLPTTGVKLPTAPISVHTQASTQPIQFSVTPAAATYQGVTWTSSDPSIAKVDAHGVVTGVKAGKVKITATSTAPVSGNAKAPSASIQVTVTQPAKSLRFSSDTLRLAKGKTEKLQPIVGPVDTTNPKVTWTSSNPQIATVSTSGSVTAKATGTVTITATTVDGSNLSSSVKVTVYQAVTGLKSAKSTRHAVSEGKTLTLAVEASPKDATNKTVRWRSENTHIATVDAATGVVTGQHAGLVKIIATAQDGSNKSCTISVYVEPRLPLEATKFTRSGYFGMYYEFAVTMKNVTKTRTVDYCEFKMEYNLSGNKYTSYYNSTYNGYRARVAGPGGTKRVGWYDDIGYKLTNCSNFRIYLTYVQYSDGTVERFSDNNLIGWFF